MFYLYDGSFDGFLCCVYAHYYQERADGIRIQGSEQMQLFYEKEVTYDEAQQIEKKAERR